MDFIGEKTRSLYWAFQGTGIKKVAKLPPSVVSLNYTFSYITSASVEGLDKWDVSRVQSMTGTFQDAKKFNQNLNSWNTSGVNDFRGLFGGATAFNQPLDKWRTPKANWLGGMFYGASSFNQP